MAVLTRHFKPIEDAHSLLGLTYRQIAAALSVDESALHRWRSGEAEPTRVYLGRLEALGEFIAELLATVDREGARQWLEVEVLALGRKRPMDLLSNGKIEPLTRLLLQVNLGTSV